jgi:hypothetical protein
VAAHRLCPVLLARGGVFFGSVVSRGACRVYECARHSAAISPLNFGRGAVYLGARDARCNFPKISDEPPQSWWWQHDATAAQEATQSEGHVSLSAELRSTMRAHAGGSK